jgi:hypothetical protein
MSFLLPRLHPSFLIILSCHLSTLQSWHFVGPSASPFVLCLNDLFSQMISCWWGLIRPIYQDLSLHLAFLCIIWWDGDVTSCMFFSRQPLFDFCWLLVDEMLFIGACRLEFLHPWWMSCVFFSQSYWSSSCALLHLRFKFISWLTQIELRVSCRG